MLWLYWLFSNLTLINTPSTYKISQDSVLKQQLPLQLSSIEPFVPATTTANVYAGVCVRALLAIVTQQQCVWRMQIFHLHSQSIAKSVKWWLHFLRRL